MAVKKSTKRPSLKKADTLKVTQLPDVFDEDASGKTATPVIEAAKEEETPQVIPVEEEKLPTPKPPRSIVTEVEEEAQPTSETPASTSEPESGEPSFTVRQNGQTVEQKLPSFFVDDAANSETQEPGSKPEDVTETTADSASEPQSAETQALEAAVPQAFVSEVREVATEAKRERKGALVTIFIILGMILVAGGVVGLFIMNTRKQNGTPSTSPEPTAQVQATPEPTPTIIIKTATPSATASVSADIKSEVKVNVLNGTAIKGLASKEAAILRKNGFTIGSVGNGDPAKAGTIVVPTGRLDMGEEIKSLLPEFSFTITEDSGVQAISVTLGEPTN